MDFANDMVTNPTRAYLGSFNGSASVTNVSNGYATINYTVSNSSGGESAGHLPYFGYSPRSDGSPRATLPNLFKTPLPENWILTDLIPSSLFNNKDGGWFGTKTQNFNWQETIRINSSSSQ